MSHSLVVLDPAARTALSRAEDRFSESTCQVLAAVLQASEPSTVAELRQATGLSRSHLGTILQRLQDAGFIVRVRRATYERSPQTHVLPMLHL